MADGYLVQRPLTREWVHIDLPLKADAPEHALSAAGTLSGTIEPAVATMLAADKRPVLEEWRSLIYHQENDEITWGGIVTSLKESGKTLSVEAQSFSTYLHGIPFMDSYVAANVDSATVIRKLWQHAQSFPDADLGVTVIGSTGVKLGDGTQLVDKKDAKGKIVKDPKTKKAIKVSVPVPYELHWYDTPDCGDELRNITSEAGVEWIERHRWNADRTDVIHEIVVAERFGRRLTGQRFVQNENIVIPVEPVRDGSGYANAVLALGAGEGKGSLRSTPAIRDGRLRRVAVADFEDIKTKSRLDSLANTLLEFKSRIEPFVDQIEVIDHTNAKLGSFNLGDTIDVEAKLRHFGKVKIPSRIVTMKTIGSRAILGLEKP